MGSCPVALPKTASWPKTPAGTPATTSAFGKQGRRQSETRTSTLEAHFQEIEDPFQLYPIDQLSVTWPNVAAREAVIYSGWPCTQLIQQGSITAREGESGFWGVTRVSTTNVSFPVFYSTFQTSGPEQVDIMPI